VDLRANSPTFGRWHAIELSAARDNAIYVPEGCAHGYQTLRDDCQIEYLAAPEYDPTSERGIRWDDPLIAIAWPIRDGVILSPQDQKFLFFDPQRTDYPA
jgi:dTDP-4-dehydrorhamnose 3,5-epimerase